MRITIDIPAPFNRHTLAIAYRCLSHLFEHKLTRTEINNARIHGHHYYAQAQRSKGGVLVKAWGGVTEEEEAA